MNELDPALIPSAWKEELAAVRAFLPDAVIAGGALRDLYLGRPVKDVDLFATAPSDYWDADALHRMLSRRSAGRTYVAGYGDMTDDVVEVWEWTDPKTRLVRHSTIFNLILLTETPGVGRFDFGVCRIMFDGQNVIATPEFHEDAANHTFTLLRSETPGQFERSVRRFERFQEKYPGWKFVNKTDQGKEDFDKSG